MKRSRKKCDPEQRRTTRRREEAYRRVSRSVSAVRFFFAAVCCFWRVVRLHATFGVRLPTVILKKNHETGSQQTLFKNQTITVHSQGQFRAREAGREGGLGEKCAPIMAFSNMLENILYWSHQFDPTSYSEHTIFQSTELYYYHVQHWASATRTTYR